KGLKTQSKSYEHIATEMPIQPAHEKVSLTIIEAIEPFSETVKESRRIRLRTRSIHFLRSVSRLNRYCPTFITKSGHEPQAPANVNAERLNQTWLSSVRVIFEASSLLRRGSSRCRYDSVHAAR